MCSGLCDLSLVVARSHATFSVDLQDDLIVEGSLFWHNVITFPSSFNMCQSYMVEILLNPTWKLYSNTSEDEIRRL